MLLCSIFSNTFYDEKQTQAMCNHPIAFSSLNITVFDCDFPVHSGTTCNVSCLYDLVANDVYECVLSEGHLPDCVAPAPPTTTTTTAPTTTTTVAPTTTTTETPTATSSDDDILTTSTPSTPEEIDPFNVIVDLVNMDDTFVNKKVNSVLESISKGVCAAIESIDSNALCTGVRFAETAARRRRSLAAGEWTATVEVYVTTSSKRDASFDYFNDDANSGALTATITISLENDGLAVAISNGELDVESSAVNISDDDDDDDEGNVSEFVVMIYRIPLDVQDADSLASQSTNTTFWSALVKTIAFYGDVDPGNVNQVGYIKINDLLVELKFEVTYNNGVEADMGTEMLANAMEKSAESGHSPFENRIVYEIQSVPKSRRITDWNLNIVLFESSDSGVDQKTYVTISLIQENHSNSTDTTLEHRYIGQIIESSPRWRIISLNTFPIKFMDCSMITTNLT